MVQRDRYLKENMEYDPNTGKLWWRKPHGKRDLSKPIGGVDGRGYLQVSTPYGNLKLHRIAWFLHYGYWPSGFIDHVNRDKTDNRLVNLREATNRQNCLNSGSHKDNLYSSYKGVSYDKRHKKWVARFSGKFLGQFMSEKEAANCYDKYTRSLGCEFARSNESLI